MGLLQLEGYPEGSDITILDCYYMRPMKDDVTGKWMKDFVVIIFIDNKTGLKQHRIIYEPDYTFYQIKDEYVQPYNQFTISKDRVVPITVPYTPILGINIVDSAKLIAAFINRIATIILSFFNG